MKIEFYPSFTWAVPVAYRRALACCSFEQGDVLYADANPYGLWPRAGYSPDRIEVYLPERKRGVIEGDTNKLFESGWEQQVQYRRWTNGKPVTDYPQWTRQGRLYRFLWLGDSNELQDEPPETLPPLTVGDLRLKRNHSRYSDVVISGSARSGTGCTFAAAIDLTSDRSLGKVRNIELAGKLDLEERAIMIEANTLWPEEPGKFLPTVQLAVFRFNVDRKAATAILKQALYKPSPGSQGEGFRVAAHGAFI
ncbi:hypothetical protein J2T57_002630 [Natronocella acetinitrilica]|uniref:Uncharacterized protein n=1 Tax=Natronocella acetinitrilica TaxID=414046 RepID=A0AAE3G460_9GAMM|nr:hypothetical protein [Natronocella acetinitrilica]MCP1675480.1 hypothetical protein [Natronocella acetinitrilica]